MRVRWPEAGKKKKERPHIPQRGDELTADWFSDVLDAGAKVVDVKREKISTDVGFMGEVFRCVLTWDSDHDGTPHDSVIVKVPTKVDANFALGDGMQLYEREIVVYRTMRDSLGLPMPGFIYAAMDPDPAPWLDRPVLFLFTRLPIGGINWVIAQFLKLAGRSKRRYILVIEDIANARPPTQHAGGTLDDAHAALTVLAQFHARNWMRAEPRQSYNRIWSLGRAPRVYQASYVRNRQAFVDRFGAALGDEIMARLDNIQARVPEINEQLGSEPWTLLHGDYRLDNLLFRPDGDIVVLDLQGLGYGRAAYDVAYFITTALTAEHRDAEQGLLRTYHDALLAQGITAYSWEQLVRDCSLTKEMLAHRIVGAGDILDTELAGEGDSLIDVLQLRVLDWLD